MSDLDQKDIQKSTDTTGSGSKPEKSGGSRLPASPPPRDVISKFRNKNAQEAEEAQMGFIDHLMELRKRLWISIIAVVLCVVLAIVFYKPVYEFLKGPIIKINKEYTLVYSEKVYQKLVRDHKDAVTRVKEELKQSPGDPLLLESLKRLLDNEPHYQLIEFVNLTTTSPLGSMMMVIWLGLWGGLVFASPIVMYEAWAFIAPGLRDKEKRAIMPILYGGVLFFLTGAAIAYFLLAPVTLGFFASLDLDLGLKNQWTSETFIELLLTMMVISGLLCEIPLLISGMAYLDILSPHTLTKHWRGFTFGSITLGAVVSPGNDLASMGAFSGLVLGIYLVSIVMAYIFHRKTPVPGAK